MLSTDPRWDKLAQILVGHSTAVASGDKVLIGMSEVETLPLVRAVHARAVRAGGHVQVIFNSAYLEADLLRDGSLEQAARVPDLEALGMDWADVYIGLRGSRSPAEFNGVVPDRFVARRRAVGELSAMRTRSTRWVIVRVPGEALAQSADMSLAQAIEFFFAATLRPWAREGQRYMRLAELFQTASTVSIEASDTQLTFSTAGRRYVVGDGHINMPDGEIYTAPVDTSAEGYITFNVPTNYWGARVDGVRLDFVAGKVVRAQAATNTDVLQRVLAIDAGAARIGEFGVGTNTGIPRFFSDILFDEKMAGTVHLALGRAYAECGGVNKSAVHWDLVKDLRHDGRILLDGRTVFSRGRWLVKW
jgi:aminopeptidase